MNDAYRPRPDDHLVEPLFEGLAGAQRESGAEDVRSSRSLLPVRWLVAATVAIACGAVAWSLW